MSLTSTLPAVLLDTVLGRLAVFFLTGPLRDSAAARHAARQMLDAYHPETADELRLAAEIISFSFHALEALSQAADPDMSLNQKLRLRGSAVSLSREAHKSQRKLDQLQKPRRAAATPHRSDIAPAEPETVQPTIDKAHPVLHAAMQNSTGQNAGGSAATSEQPKAAAPVQPRNDGRTWTQAYQQRQAARRITENLKKANATALTTAAAAHPAVLAGWPHRHQRRHRPTNRSSPRCGTG